MNAESKKNLAKVGKVFGVDIPKLYRRIFVFVLVVAGAYALWFNFVVDATWGGPEAWVLICIQY